jgi:hypothetical protein
VASQHDSLTVNLLSHMGKINVPFPSSPSKNKPQNQLGKELCNSTIESALSSFLKQKNESVLKINVCACIQN